MRSSPLALLALTLLACGGEKPAVKTSSSPKPPSWLAKAPTSAETLYFSGAKEGAYGPAKVAYWAAALPTNGPAANREAAWKFISFMASKSALMPC